MAGTRPTSGKQYQSPADEGTPGASTYTPPGAPMSILNNSYAPQATSEAATDSRRADPTPSSLGDRKAPSVPAPGQRVVHRTSGQHGTVAGHAGHGYSGTAVPRVTWDGEEASWPQGVSANALCPEGSHPSDLQQWGGPVGTPPSAGAGSDSPADYTRSDGAL
jgi:hypothetical protein